MKNNAFAQVHRAFYSLIAPNKSTPTRRASAWRETSARATGGSPVSDATTRGIGGSGARETLSPPPESAAEAAGGGGHASSGGTSPHSPPGGGETPRGQSQGDRRKPRERRRNPRNRRVGGTGNPQSSTRRRSGGGRRWRACIKWWNVATLSPRRRGDTARPISTQPKESAGRLPGWIKIPSRPGTCIRRGSRAPQAADHRRGERAKRGETTSRRSGYSPAGMAGCAPEAGGSSVAMGDCPLSAGKNSTPSVPPGRWAVRRKRINVDIWRKFDVVNEIRAPLRRTSVIAKASPPQPSRHNRKPRGTAGARKSDRATLRRPSGTAKANPPQPPRHNRKPLGTTGA